MASSSEASKRESAPFVFAEALWSVVDVTEIQSEGVLRPAAGGSIDDFVHANMVLHGCWTTLLRLREGIDAARIPAAIPMA